MKKSFIILTTLFLSLVSFVSAQIGENCGFSGMMSGAYGFGGMWIFGWLFMILVLVALVLLIIWLTKQIQKK